MTGTPHSVVIKGNDDIGDGGESLWVRIPQSVDAISADNDNDIVVDRYGNRWYRATGDIDVEMGTNALRVELGMPYEATGDGETDDAAALSAADQSGLGRLYLRPGTYRIGSDITLTTPLVFTQGATLQPASGVTVTLAAIPDAGFAEIFDLSDGGEVAITARGAVRVDWWGGRTSAACQAAVDGAAEGSQIVFETAAYVWDATVTATKSHELVGNRATIAATSVLQDAIVFDAVSRPRVSGFIYEGAEDATSYAGDTPSSSADVYSFIKFATCIRPRAFDIDVSGVRCGVLFDTCTAPSADRIEMIGFLGDTAGGGASDANFCMAVRVHGGSDYKVSNVHAEECGDALIVANEATRGLAFGISGRHLHDNGVYVSSGTQTTNALCLFSEVTGTGVKARGSQHLALGNNVDGVNTGISLTGNGATPDAEGANGHALSAVANLVSDYSFDGVSTGVQDGLYPRDVAFALNVIADGVNTGGYAAVRSTVLDGWIVLGNMSVADGGTTAAMVISGLPGTPSEDITVLANHIRGGASQGIRGTYLDHPTIALNQIRDVTATSAIELRVTNHAFVVGNNTTGKTIHITSGNSNADAVVGVNKGTVSASGASATFDNNP